MAWSKPSPGPSWQAWRTQLSSTAEDHIIELWEAARRAQAFLGWAEEVAECTRRMLSELEALGYKLDP